MIAKRDEERKKKQRDRETQREGKNDRDREQKRCRKREEKTLDRYRSALIFRDVVEKQCGKIQRSATRVTSCNLVDLEWEYCSRKFSVGGCLLLQKIFNQKVQRLTVKSCKLSIMATISVELAEE